MKITEESGGGRTGVKTSQAFPNLWPFPLFHLASFHLSCSSVSILDCLVWLHIACLAQLVLDIHCSYFICFFRINSSLNGNKVSRDSSKLRKSISSNSQQGVNSQVSILMDPYKIYVVGNSRS